MLTALLETTADATQSGGWLIMLIQLLPILLIVVVM